MRTIRRIKLQAALEMATNYALETGDKSVYQWPSYKETKRELAEEIETQKNGHDKHNGDYGGGGC